MAEYLENDNLPSSLHQAANMKHNEEKEALLMKIKCLEVHLKSDEVISILFLLHKNAKETYRDLEDFLNGGKSNLIYKWCKQSADTEKMWESKLYESLFLIKNYRMLKEFDIEAVNAVHTFNHKYLIPNIRMELYKICEHIYGFELKTLLTYMGETEVKDWNDTCLEMYLLKWISEKIISLDNEVNIKVLADSLQAIRKTDFADRLLRFQSSKVPLAPAKPVKEYPIINPKNVGLCLIINQKKFTQDPLNPKMILKERNGTQFDGTRLEELFRMNFKFEVKVKNDIASGIMLEIIHETIKTYFKVHHSVFMLIILSHGSKDHIFGTDSRAVPILRIDSCLKIPQLEGKPKVIIIQACQGDYYVKSLPPAAPVNSKIEDDGMPLKDWATDTIFCMSTIPLFATPRHIEKGAWYIIKLCEMLEEYSEEDLCSILTRLSDAMKNEPVFGTQNQIMVIPEFKSRLTKKLYLKKVQK